jgi:hypothetical protein
MNIVHLCCVSEKANVEEKHVGNGSAAVCKVLKRKYF